MKKKVKVISINNYKNNLLHVAFFSRNRPVKLRSVFGIVLTKLNFGMGLYLVVLNNMSKVPIDPTAAKNFTEGRKKTMFREYRVI